MKSEFFGDNKVVLLYRVCKYYFSHSHFCVRPVRYQDQCYHLCRCCIICCCWNYDRL